MSDRILLGFEFSRVNSNQLETLYTDLCRATPSVTNWSRNLTAVKRLRPLFFISGKIIHDDVEASVKICKIAAKCKYIFSSLK